MIKKIYIALALVALLAGGTLKAQVNVSQQLGTIPDNLNKYLDGYLHDLSNYQGIAYLNSLNSTGRILGKRELRISLNVGSVISSANSIRNTFTPNFDLRGNAPSLFGSGTEGSLAFRFLDEKTGGAMVDPFTGKEIGFSIPFLPGAELGVGISPAVMPVVSMGIGYGTEVSVSALPGAIKAASKSFTGDFEIDKDMMYSIGVRHDILYWAPSLSKRNFSFTVGAAYNKMTIGATTGKGLFDDFANADDTYVLATNNLTGVEYGFSSLGFEAMLSKKLAFIDLSVFASTNKSDYYIQSEGNIVVKTAKNFYSDNTQGYDTNTLENLVDIEGKVKQVIYGAAIQFNLGRIFLGAKGGISEGAAFAAASIGFKILKQKKSEEILPAE